MPLLQDRARENSSSDDETKSCDEDGIYDDGEYCGYKARTLHKIIGGDSSFPNNALFKYSILGPAQFNLKFHVLSKLEFRQAKE